MTNTSRKSRTARMSPHYFSRQSHPERSHLLGQVGDVIDYHIALLFGRQDPDVICESLAVAREDVSGTNVQCSSLRDSRNCSLDFPKSNKFDETSAEKLCGVKKCPNPNPNPDKMLSPHPLPEWVLVFGGHVVCFRADITLSRG